MIEVRTARLSEATSLGAKIIGEAFAEDPVSRWTLGQADTICDVFAFLARYLYVPAGSATIVDGTGGALWLAPRAPKDLRLRHRARLIYRLGRGAGLRTLLRADAVDRAMLARKPRTPHFYLFAIGVRVEARGRGVAGALLRHTLAQADRQGMPAYLENTNPPNTPLYRRFGFEPGEAFAPAPGCPPILPMWRPGRNHENRFM